MNPGVASSPWVLALAAGLVSFVVSLLWRRFALRRALLDAPGERRLHAAPTPRGGGIGIALVLLSGAGLMGQGGPAFALGLLFCAGVGLVDDLRPLRALPKLLLQSAGALPPALAWPLLPEWLGGPGAVFAAWLLVLGLVNVWNFMDGSNGMAAGQALLVAAALAALAGLAPGPGLVSLVLAAACLGFLPLNLPRARLFMGDVGSHALGYAVAVLGLAVLAGDAASGWQLLLLPSAFLVDASLTVLGRMRRRQRFWLAHREHLYQRAVAHGWSHVGIGAAYAAWTVAAGALALGLAGAPAAWQAACVAGVFAAGILLYLRVGRRWPRSGPSLESVA